MPYKAQSITSRLRPTISLGLNRLAAKVLEDITTTAIVVKILSFSSMIITVNVT